MKDNEFDISSELDTELEAADSMGTPTSNQDSRRRLENLLDRKRLRSELNEYDDSIDQQRSYYEDDIFSDFYKDHEYDSEDNSTNVNS